MLLALVGTNLFAGTGQGDGATTGGVFLSTDNGASWKASSNGLPLTSSVGNFAVSGTNLFAADNYLKNSARAGGVYLSSDYGAHWTSVNTGLPNTLIWSLAVSGSFLFAGTISNGVWRRPLSEMIATNTVAPSRPEGNSISAYPNPFSHSTTITFTSNGGYVNVSVVDLLGKEVARLFSGNLSSGNQYFIWDASTMPTGMYECVVQSGTQIQRVSMIVER